MINASKCRFLYIFLVTRGICHGAVRLPKFLCFRRPCPTLLGSECYVLTSIRPFLPYRLALCCAHQHKQFWALCKANRRIHFQDEAGKVHPKSERIGDVTWQPCAFAVFFAWREIGLRHFQTKHPLHLMYKATWHIRSFDLRFQWPHFLFQQILVGSGQSIRMARMFLMKWLKPGVTSTWPMFGPTLRPMGTSIASTAWNRLDNCTTSIQYDLYIFGYLWCFNLTVYHCLSSSQGLKFKFGLECQDLSYFRVGIPSFFGQMRLAHCSDLQAQLRDLAEENADILGKDRALEDRCDDLVKSLQSTKADDDCHGNLMNVFPKLH